MGLVKLFVLECSADMSDVEAGVSGRGRGETNKGRGTEDTNLLSIHIGKKSGTSFQPGCVLVPMLGIELLLQICYSIHYSDSCITVLPIFIQIFKSEVELI